MKRLLLTAAFAATSALAAGGSTVLGSKHDLSITGPGPIRAVGESQSCVFCHLTHGGSGRSSRPEPSAALRPYESSTMKARAGVPTGTSRICLSCHDGTIAVGQTIGRRFEVTGPTTGGRLPGDRRSNLGTDLRRSHPISFPPAFGGAMRPPPGHGGVGLDKAGQLQCTSCHDPHSEFGGAPEGKFLLAGSRGSELCSACHVPAAGSSHAASPAPFDAARGNDGGYASVADAGCLACHRTHGADTKGQLLARGAAEDDDQVCLRCHGQGVTRLDLRREVSKPSHHSAGSGRHDAGEGPDSATHRLPETSIGAPRHATCVDCHDPHQANGIQLAPPSLPGTMTGAWGIDLDGRKVSPARFEYEVCLKCHGDSVNQPQATGSVTRPGPRRAVPDANLRRVFAASAPSFHPVTAPGRNPDVPSLRAPLTPASLIYCADCHASDDGPGAGGSGPRGPHGSIYPALLERNYATADRTVESPSSYALCYKCHDRDVLLSDQSAFPEHKRHVVLQSTPCAACHASHGVSGRSGTAAANSHLIDFDVDIVQPTAAGLRRYTSLGARSGSCSLTCHGQAHDQSSYSQTLVPR